MLRHMWLRTGRRPWWALLPIIPLLLAACGAGAPSPGAPQDESITLYTCVSDTTVQPVIESSGPRIRAARSGSSGPRRAS